MIFKYIKNLKIKNERQQKSIQELKSLLNNKTEECRILNDENFNLKVEKTNWLDAKALYTDKMESLNKDNEYLKKQNEVLLEWIYKIIDEAHVYGVKDHNTFNIPIYKEDKYLIAGGKLDGNIERFDADPEYITIPEIRLIKYGGKYYGRKQ